MMGGGWRHQEAEPSCGFVDESFGPAHALRAVWTARGQRARRALPTACPHSRASRPQLHRTDNHFFSQVVCTTGTHAFDPDQPIGSKSPKSLLTSDASRPIIPSSRKRHPTSTSLATRPISPSLSHWTAGSSVLRQLELFMREVEPALEECIDYDSGARPGHRPDPPADERQGHGPGHLDSLIQTSDSPTFGVRIWPAHAQNDSP